MHEVKDRAFSLRIEDVVLPFGKDRIGPFSFSIDPGDVCHIYSDASDKANAFLRFLSTLLKPLSGHYILDGQALDFSDYRSLFPVKRRIAYISTEAALITNRSLQENILMGDAWYKDTTAPEMDPYCAELCRLFFLNDRLHLRPEAVGPMGQRAAIVVRAFAKNPGLILVERPDVFMGKKRKDVFLSALKANEKKRAAIVYWTDDAGFGKGWYTRKWLLEENSFRECTLDKKE